MAEAIFLNREEVRVHPLYYDPGERLAKETSSFISLTDMAVGAREGRLMCCGHCMTAPRPVVLGCRCVRRVRRASIGNQPLQFLRIF